MPDCSIYFEHLAMRFEIEDREHEVFEDLNLCMDPKAFTVLLGRSGCGKTTLLRLLSGLIEPSAGSIHKPEDLQMGMMFQEARLMPWLNCEKNVTLGMKKPDMQRVRDILKLVGLEGFGGAYPNQLSGGMQQRAALARTLIRDSKLILMDEPFAALDAFTRQSMQQELLRIRRESGCGVILVTHNIDEALLLADRILLLQEGKALRDYTLPPQNGGRDILTEPYIGIKKEVQELLKG